VLRKTLTPLEEARAVEKMLADGYTVDGAATVIGWHKRRVSARRRILELPETAQPLVGSVEIPVAGIDALLDIQAVSPKLAAPVAEVIAEAAAEGGRGLWAAQAGRGGQPPGPARLSAVVVCVGAARADARDRAAGRVGFHAWRGAAQLLTRVLAYLPDGHGEVSARFDSGFYRIDLLADCRARGVRFSISVPRSNAMWSALKRIPEHAWEPAEGLKMPKSPRRPSRLTDGTTSRCG
jgi:hypothetical protein